MEKVFFFSFFFLTACCYKGPKTIYGKVRPGKVYRLSYDDAFFNYVDTNAIYEIYKAEYSSGWVVDYDSVKQQKEWHTVFVRFYGNGKVSYFYKTNLVPKTNYFEPSVVGHQLKHEDFDPKKGLSGWCYRLGEKQMVKFAGINQCSLDFSRSEIIAIGDTIILDFTYPKGTKKSFLKTENSKSLVEGWKPDW